ncbi:PepSY domain-containing protein [Paracidovorax citrulli]|nr:PepSY domain-containing protein [Paracidovorax citrulli]
MGRAGRVARPGHAGRQSAPAAGLACPGCRHRGDPCAAGSRASHAPGRTVQWTRGHRHRAAGPRPMDRAPGAGCLPPPVQDQPRGGPRRRRRPATVRLPRAAEVVRDTRRSERFWNWLGAVPHWIYPTALRQFPQAWNQVVVWLSIPGVVVAATGLALGIWQLFAHRSRWIPYRKFWMRWHHLLGLCAGVATLTWILSGLLSMNPFGVFGDGAPETEERRRWQGAAATPVHPVASALADSRRKGLRAVELELVVVGGQSWYRLREAGRGWLIRADAAGAGEVVERLPASLMASTLSGLRRHPPVRLERLTSYDGLYYARHPLAPETRWLRPLPVWRATWADGTAAYADPGSGRILLRADPRRQWQRVLYNGLHSLDFAPLLARPMLRDALVLGLSAAGFLTSVTACVLAWRALSRGRRTRVPARPSPGPGD